MGATVSCQVEGGQHQSSITAPPRRLVWVGAFSEQLSSRPPLFEAAGKEQWGDLGWGGGRGVPVSPLHMCQQLLLIWPFWALLACNYAGVSGGL